jgi:hypothetical protein
LGQFGQFVLLLRRQLPGTLFAVLVGVGPVALSVHDDGVVYAKLTPGSDQRCGDGR